MKRKLFFIFLLYFSFQIYSKQFDLDLNVSNYHYLYNYNSTCDITNINLDFTYIYKKVFLYVDIPFSVEKINLLNSNDKSRRFSVNDISTFLGYCQSLSKLDFNYYLGLKFNTKHCFYQSDKNELFSNSNEDNNNILYPLLRFQIVIPNEPFIVKPALEFSFDILQDEDIYKTFILNIELQTICLMNNDISYFFTIKQNYLFETNTTQIDINNAINFFINDKFYIRPGIDCIYKNGSILIGLTLTFSY